MSETDSTLTFITESLPVFVVSEPQNFVIEASGGQTPYNFEISDGELPEGLTLDESGTIYGTPTELVKGTSVTIMLTDADGNHVSQDFEVFMSKSQTDDEDEDDDDEDDD